MSSFVRTFLAWCRTIHIYVSLLIFLAMIFFSLTGIFLNHEDWFGLDDVQRVTKTGEVPLKLVEYKEPPEPPRRPESGNADEEEEPEKPAELNPPDKFAVVENLRAQFNLTGAVEAFDVDEEQIQVTFKSPARHTEATITRADGKVEVTLEYQGVVALFNDLHKGRSTGDGWRLLIDIAAGVMIVSALSGLFLWVALPKRRILGIVSLVLGIAVGFVVYWMLVP